MQHQGLSGESAMEFAEEPGQVAKDGDGSSRAWRVLLVDDERDVHLATEFAMSDALVERRPIEFLHAYSAAEARSVLATESDIAVILLDVVMETEHAGLDLVQVVREEFGLRDVRIVLRTGQPGYAPEIEAIRDYDINDYKTKGELTRTRLYTTLTAAIRGYEQLRLVNASTRGLETIVRSAAELAHTGGLQVFAAAVVTRLAELLGVPADGLVCVHARQGDGDAMVPRVISAAGAYRPFEGVELARLPDTGTRTRIEQCLAGGSHVFADRYCELYFSGRFGGIAVVHLDTARRPDAIDVQLVEVFASSVAAGLENAAMFARLERAAYHDTLVDLPNRNGLLELVEADLAGARAEGVLAIVDVDQFADLNNALGQQYGDQLLKAVAERLARAFPEDRVARIGADQFAVLGDRARVSADGIRVQFEEPFAIGEDRLRVSASLGVLRLADIEGGGEDALTHATLALASAKSRQHSRVAEYTPALMAEIRHRVGLLRELREALPRAEFHLAYQPQVRLSDGRPVGLEALLRWRRPDGANVSPAEFVPVAERSGMILAIGDWALRAALEDLGRLHADGMSGLRMAVNMSAIQVRHPDFADSIARALAETGIASDLLEIEITESIAMGDLEGVRDALQAVKSLGVSIAIDDFGTGFSSLAYLHRLPVDRLKIDRAFVSGIGGAARDRSIARTVIELGRSLELAVIAEGVETPDQANILLGMGCPEAQGFHFARPMETAALTAWLRSPPGSLPA